MTPIPSDDQIRGMVRNMRRTDKQWDQFEQDALEIARRMRSGSTTVDGFTSNHGAAGMGGGGGMRVKVGTTRVFTGYDEDGNEEYDDVDVFDTVPASQVETMALGGGEPDPTHPQMVLLFDMLNQGAASSRAAFNTRDRILKMQTPDKAPGKTGSPCKSHVNGCDGTGTRKGWCDACRKWCERNPTIDGVERMAVPADVIAERTKRREKVKGVPS